MQRCIREFWGVGRRGASVALRLPTTPQSLRRLLGVVATRSGGGVGDDLVVGATVGRAAAVGGTGRHALWLDRLLVFLEQEAPRRLMLPGFLMNGEEDSWQ